MESCVKGLGGSPKAESAGEEARRLLIEIAGRITLEDSVKTVLGRVARALGLGDRRVRAIWNREARAIRSEEMDALRAAAAERRKLDAIKAGRDDAVALAAMFSRVLASDADAHPHLAREEVDALRAIVERIGAGDRTGTGGAGR